MLRRSFFVALASNTFYYPPSPPPPFLAPCKDNEARCQSSTRCLSMYDLCDGEPHCPRAEDEDPKFCRAFSCPTERPFR